MDFEVSLNDGLFSQWQSSTKDGWWGFLNAKVKPPPTYNPPPNRLVINFMASILDVKEKLNWPLLKRSTILDLAEWYAQSTQTYQPGKLNVEQIGDKNNPEFYDCFSHMMGCYWLMAQDYKDFNSKRGVDFYQDWLNPPWKQAIRVPATPYTRGRDLSTRTIEIQKLLAQIPGPTGFYRPREDVLQGMFVFYEEARRKIDFEGQPMMLPRSDLQKYNNVVMPPATKSLFLSWIQQAFPILKEQFEAFDKDYPIPENLPYYQWYGQFIDIAYTKIVSSGAWSPREVKVWPTRIYVNEIWDLVASDDHSQYAVDSFKRGYYYEPPIITYPCPSEQQVKTFEVVYSMFKNVNFTERKVMWTQFHQSDLAWIIPLYTEGDPSQLLADQNIWVAQENIGSALKWAQNTTEFDFYSPNVQAGISYLVFGVIIYSIKLHYRMGGRDYNKWIWNKKGDYVNPTPEESYADCLRHSKNNETDEYGNTIKCLPDNTVGWEEPWNLKGKALADYINAKAPIPNVRPPFIGESLAKYERAKVAIFGNYVQWKNAIMENPAFLKEHAIGSDFKAEDGSTVSNFYVDYGLLEPEGTTQQQREAKYWYAPYYNTYGITLIDELIAIGQKIMTLVLKAIKEVAKDAGDFLKDASTPLLLIGLGVGAVILSIGAASRLSQEPRK